MAVKALNSVAGFSVGEIPNVVIYANSDIVANNLDVTGKSNLNSISNVKITGGSLGYLISTDGTGNLSFIAPPSTTGITNGTSNVSIPQINGNITINVGGIANVLLVTTSGTDSLGNINPATSNTYQLGNSSSRWNNIYANTGNFSSNINVGNIIATNSLNGATANITNEALLGSIKTSNITATSGNIDIYAAGSNNSVNITPTGNGTVNVNNARITNLAEPNNSSDAATKNYVDTVAQGLHVHTSAYVATNTTLAILSGGTVTYNNGTSGVGANLVTTGTFNLIDGGNVQTVGTRIIVKNEANAVWNGIYTYANTTTLVRATDFDTSAEAAGGDFVFVTSGTMYADTGWVQTTDNPIIGVSPILWQQFSGAGTYTAGQGLLLTGTVFSANVDNVTTAIVNGNIAIKSNAILTTPNIGDATFSSLVWNNSSNGNIIANNLNISNTANISGNLIVSGKIQSNLEISSNANVSGTNLTTTGNVSANGNIIAGNITANSTLYTINANFSGNTITNYLTVNNAIVGNTANFNGNVVLPNLTINLELTGNTANFNGNITANSWLYVANTANVGNLRTDNLLYANGQPWDLQQAAGSNAQIQYNDGLGNFGASANFKFDYSSNELVLNGKANISTGMTLGNTNILWGTVTTNSITANQTIASISTTGVTGLEFLVKGIDSSGTGKYSVATVQAVTNGSNVDYSTFGTVYLGGSTGSLSVNVSGGYIRLQVTPSSSNSTVWTTQARII